MPRKAKYATLKQYQPYIDAIRKDLGIPENYPVFVEFVTRNGRSGGSGIGLRTYGKIKLAKNNGHEWTVRALMHEFMHVKQYITEKLKDVYVPAILVHGKKKRNTGKWRTEWQGVLYNTFVPSIDKNKTKKYMNSPWEVEAREYEEEVKRLFPGFKAPNTRVLIGTNNKGSTFYKVTQA